MHLLFCDNFLPPAMIVEEGDAGVSGLPAVIAPEDFYGALCGALPGPSAS